MAPNPTNPQAPCRLYMGTSGYSFPEWIDAGFNHVRGQAPQNARMLIEQLAGRGYEFQSMI